MEMALPKLAPRDRVLVTKGEYEGQEGDVFGYDNRTRKYIVKVHHAGFPENHYHYIRIEARFLEKVA